nr:aldehyde dehydrogenase family protein [Roseovarius azorensis]
MRAGTRRQIAQILFPDADLDVALPVLIKAIIQNCGQTCSASSRVLVHRPICDTVAEAIQDCFSQTATSAR